RVYHAVDMRVVQAAIATALIANAALAQDTTVFRTETRLVEVTLIATGRDGHPVADLTVDDIELLDNGKPQRIQSFLPIGSYGEALAQAPGQAVKAVRHTVLLL